MDFWSFRKKIKSIGFLTKKFQVFENQQKSEFWSPLLLSAREIDDVETLYLNIFSSDSSVDLETL